MGKPSDMTIVWCGTMAVLLARLKRKPYEVTRIKHDETERIKRLGVYYMCIDDQPGINEACESFFAGFLVSYIHY